MLLVGFNKVVLVASREVVGQNCTFVAKLIQVMCIAYGQLLMES